MAKKRFVLLLIALAMINLSLADSDHYEARRLMQAGSILPLETVLESIQQRRPGRILEVELEQERSRYVYEIELLDNTGRVWEMKLDAVTGEYLTTELED
jgi:uncharacterized membrane protein YkoI